MGRPVFRAAADNNSMSSPGVISVPTGTLNGDVMFMALFSSTAGAYTTPTGWTIVDANTTGGGVPVNWTLYRRVAASEPANYSITFAGGTFNGFIVSYSSARPEIEGQTAPNATTGTTPASLGVTSTFPNELVIFLAGTVATITASPPAGMTQRVINVTVNNNYMIADLAWDTPGATGGKSISTSVNGSWIVVSFGLRSSDSSLIVTD